MEMMPTANSAVSMLEPTMTASRFLGGGVLVREAVLEERSTEASVGKKMRNSMTLEECQYGSVSARRTPATSIIHVHEHETAPLQADLGDSQQCRRTLAAADQLATGHVAAAAGENEDVADGGDAGQAAEQHPPGRQTLAAAAGDDLEVLRQVGDEDAQHDEAGQRDGVRVGREEALAAVEGVHVEGLVR